MLEAVEFKNYRVLRNARLPLSRCTLILGPNGSGKSTAMRGIMALSGAIASGSHINHASDRNADEPLQAPIELSADAVFDQLKCQFRFVSYPDGRSQMLRDAPVAVPGAINWFSRVRGFSFDANSLAKPFTLQPSAEIRPDGSSLPVVLTQLQDQFPERFEALNSELPRWFPGFNRVLFETPGAGERGLSLRTTVGGHRIAAPDLSQGTLLALAILTLAHLPQPPTLVCIEEPDRGIHPRLLRQVHDAMMRLSNPAASGDQRGPVQVIATTHSPYFLDLFRDHPEDVVLSEKTNDGATFHRLSDLSHYEDIIHDAQLSDAWYSGILGGVPVSP